MRACACAVVSVYVYVRVVACVSACARVRSCLCVSPVCACVRACVGVRPLAHTDLRARRPPSPLRPHPKPGGGQPNAPAVFLWQSKFAHTCANRRPKLLKKGRSTCSAGFLVGPSEPELRHIPRKLMGNPSLCDLVSFRVLIRPQSCTRESRNHARSMPKPNSYPKNPT